MSKTELLAPAGNMESLKTAVYNGADAVYLGIKEFNARNNIQGFSLDTLSQAVNFAHLYGVKVYLALNILFKDDELQSAMDIVCEANNIGVDAFIVQDLGLAYLIRSNYPSVELHASTQMAVHNLEGVKVLEKLGFKRVVLARETSLSEIERIKQYSDIEIEFFIQGALCVSFSGNCYMCSHLVDKSGNRGVCQQFCRLPYTFESGKNKNLGFLLSAKDICMLDRLKDLQDAGVVSLKIEGRARRPFYVAQACKIYRDALDSGKYLKDDFDSLTLAFNRQFTPAYFNGNAGIISKIQGNNGLELGVVKQVKNGTKFNEIFISTKYNLQPKSGLKFVLNGQEVASIGAYDVKRIGDLYRVTTTAKIKAGSKVYIIQDDELEQKVLQCNKKLAIDINIVAVENKPIRATAKYGGVEACAEGEVCQKAKTISVSQEQILKQFARSDVFEINNFKCELNNCYILNSTINKLRNGVYQKLQEKIIKKYEKSILNKIKVKLIKNTTNKELLNRSEFNFKIINNIKNINFCENIIFDYNVFNKKDLEEFDAYCQANNVNGYIDLPNFATSKDIELLQEVLDKTCLGVVANNLYAFNFNCKMIAGQFLNIYNGYSLIALNSLHKLDAGFIEELNKCEINELITEEPLVKREKVYMTLLHCPFKENVGCNCSNCSYNENASLTINSGKKFIIKRKKTSSCVFLLKE